MGINMLKKCQDLVSFAVMRNLLSIFLVLIFMLPTLGPWMPHDALKALHVQQERHHGGNPDQHDHHGHSHDAKAKASHSVHFDVVTYFSDYLHVELKNTDHASLETPDLDNHKIDFIQMATLIPPSFPSSTNVQTTGPPPDNWRLTRPDLPIYLATQRLRI